VRRALIALSKIVAGCYAGATLALAKGEAQYLAITPE
jgi:hypothetical protein